jgi:hypothetical protein
VLDNKISKSTGSRYLIPSWSKYTAGIIPSPEIINATSTISLFRANVPLTNEQTNAIAISR